jgi:hypothetical protein
LGETNLLAARLYNEDLSTDAYFEALLIDEGPVLLARVRKFLVFPFLWVGGLAALQGVWIAYGASVTLSTEKGAGPRSLDLGA